MKKVKPDTFIVPGLTFFNNLAKEVSLFKRVKGEAQR